MSKYNEKIEDSMRIQRSIIVFEHAINSEHTKKQYYYWLNRFLKFCKIQDYDSLLTLSPNKLQMMECLVDVASWFIPEYPKFLWFGGHRVHQNIFHN